MLILVRQQTQITQQKNVYKSTQSQFQKRNKGLLFLSLSLSLSPLIHVCVAHAFLYWLVCAVQAVVVVVVAAV